jgi:flagellar motor switch protein FliM
MTRSASPLQFAPAPSEGADDGWDMSYRREGQVMAETAKIAEVPSLPRAGNGGRALLSQAEIEALLRPDLTDMPVEPETPVATAPRTVPDFAPTSGRSLDDDICRRLAARFAMALREHTQLTVAAAVETHQRAPFDVATRQAGEERGQAIATFVRMNGDIGALLVLSPGLAQLLIETACGARARTGSVRPLSPIDTAILSALLQPVADALSPALRLSGIETEIAFAASITPPAESIALTLSMRANGEALRASLIFDAELGQATAELASALAPARENPPAAIAVTLTARIASLAVPLSKLSGLKPGATLLLGVPADQPVELISGGEGGLVAAEAEIGRRGNRIAVRITRRTGALGPLTRRTP